MVSLASRASRLLAPSFLALLILAVTGPGCLRRTTRVAPPPVAVQTATLEELLDKLSVFANLESMRATVDLQLSYFSDDQTRRTDLRDVRGFILARRPALARIQAQYPVTRQKAFDMVSNGNLFRVYLVWRSRFFEGETDLDVRSEKRSENIRPQHIVEPLFIAPPAPEETAVLENRSYEGRAYHIVQLQKPSSDGKARITRKAWFDRETLELARLEVFDADGNAATEADYYDWAYEGGEPYPSQARVSRPIDGYELTVTFITPGLNEPVPDSAFVLDAPDGVEVERIGEEDEPSEPAKAASVR